MTYRTIYLAGKIAKNDWRHEVVPDLRDASCGDERPWVYEHWRTIPTIFPGIVYSGPYFTGCDHGCCHFDGNHGILERPVCGQNSPRQLIPSLCLNAIRNSDIIFAWLGPDFEEPRFLATDNGSRGDVIPDPFSCYGTMLELGYAKAVGCKIITAAPYSEMLGGPYDLHETAPLVNREPLGWDELWFAHQIADHNIVAPDPVTAITETLAKNAPQPPSPFGQDSLCL